MRKNSSVLKSEKFVDMGLLKLIRKLVLLQIARDHLNGSLCKIAEASVILGYVVGTGAVFIPKAGKCGLTSPKYFQLSSVTSFILEMVEGLIDRYIRDNKPNWHELHKKHATCP